MSNILRKCKQCGKESPPYPLDDFVRQPDCRHSVQNLCRKCHGEKSRERRRNNKTHIRVQKKEYSRIHAEEIKERKNQYYLNNKEKILERNKRWRQENLERHRVLCRKAATRWNNNHHERYLEHKRLHSRRRRAAENNALGSFTDAEFWDVCKSQNWHCAGCDSPLDKKTATRDHIVPISNGGSDFIENIQALCAPCNSRKYTNSMAELKKSLALSANSTSTGS